MKKLLYTFLALTIIFSSCEKDNKSAPAPLPVTNTQNIYSVIEITNSPGGTYTFNSGSSMTNLQVSSGGSLSYTSDMNIFEWISGNQLNHSISLLLSTTNVGCADIEIRTYNNSNLVNTENFQIGYSQFSPNVFCDNLVANNLFTKSISITAD
tara:strand:+ start:689 stop:1147 length:459 start_codon:yes stop_codon:yes gene_type:complete